MKHALNFPGFSIFLTAILIAAGIISANGVSAAETITGISYARAGDEDLLLDLYLPDADNTPLIVWIHGGAWRFGDRSNPPVLDVLDEGFAVASIEFRHATTAPFPGQVHDIRAAVRFLRARADEYGFDGSRIALWGISSGGHLAAITGMTSDVPAMEGDLGDYTGTDSSVQAIIDMAGPADLTTILSQSTAFGVNVRAPALEILLGGAMEDEGVMDTARAASPYFHVDAGDPPLLLMHGMQDVQVPINQALQMEDAYRRQGLPVESYWIPNGEHGTPYYYQSPWMDSVLAFLHRYLE